MNALKRLRQQRQLSQRKFSRSSGVSFRTIQLLESKRHDPQISTLEKVYRALGYPKNFLKNHLERQSENPPDSIVVISEAIAAAGEDSWKIFLFNFVDAFRAAENPLPLILEPPSENPALRLLALLASTVEQCCALRSMVAPWWAKGAPGLEDPWFVSGVENLKASALVESPAHFRKRNIFVLENFLERR